MTPPRAVLRLVPLALAAGCVQFSYNRVTYDEPLRQAQLTPLRPGVDRLDDCLRRLGAPHRVFEYRVTDDGASGMALLWVWSEAAGWGLDISGGYEEASGSLSYDKLSTELPGCVLWFDAELRLERWQRGTLGELLPSRRRPSLQPADPSPQ